MIVENQEIIPVQPSEAQKEIEKLELELIEKKIKELEQKLIKKKQRVAIVTQKISFRPKGQNSKWTEELIKTKAEVQDISNQINRLVDRITTDFLKKYEKDEKIVEEERLLAEERKKALTLFEEYKNGEYLKNNPAELKITPKPSFDHIGVKISREIQEALRLAQDRFDSAEQKSKGRSPAYRGKYSDELQRARNELNLIALRDAENESILIENEVMKAEIGWRDMELAERKAYSLELQAYYNKMEKDLALFEKSGLIPEFKK